MELFAFFPLMYLTSFSSSSFNQRFSDPEQTQRHQFPHVHAVLFHVFCNDAEASTPPAELGIWPMPLPHNFRQRWAKSLYFGQIAPQGGNPGTEMCILRKCQLERWLQVEKKALRQHWESLGPVTVFLHKTRPGSCLPLAQRMLPS